MAPLVRPEFQDPQDGNFLHLNPQSYFDCVTESYEAMKQVLVGKLEDLQDLARNQLAKGGHPDTAVQRVHAARNLELLFNLIKCDLLALSTIAYLTSDTADGEPNELKKQLNDYASILQQDFDVNRRLLGVKTRMMEQSNDKNVRQLGIAYRRRTAAVIRAELWDGLDLKLMKPLAVGEHIEPCQVGRSKPKEDVAHSDKAEDHERPEVPSCNEIFNTPSAGSGQVIRVELSAEDIEKLGNIELSDKYSTVQDLMNDLNSKITANGQYRLRQM